MKTIFLILISISFLFSAHKMQFKGHFKDELFIFEFHHFNKKLCKFNKIKLCKNAKFDTEKTAKKVEEILQKNRFFFVRFIRADKGFFHCEVWDNEKFYNFELVKLGLALPLIKNKRFNQALKDAKKTKGGICE